MRWRCYVCREYTNNLVGEGYDCQDMVSYYVCSPCLGTKDYMNSHNEYTYHCDHCGVFGTTLSKKSTGLDLFNWMVSTGWELLTIDNCWHMLCPKCLITARAYNGLK